MTYYVLTGEPDLRGHGLFDLALDVRVRGVAIEVVFAVDLELAENRIGQIVTIGVRAVAVETWIFERSRGGLRVRCRPGHAGRYRFRGQAIQGAVPFSPGYGLRDGGQGQAA